MQIQITERGFTKNKFKIEVFVNNTLYKVVLPNPADEKQENELEWYFENYISEPYITKVKVEKCKKILKEYGKKLFASVFKSNTDLNFAYRTIVQDHGIDELEFCICGDTPEFHDLHWEAMYDKELPYPFAANGAAFIRQNLKPRYVEANVSPSPYINLLIVTARPEWEGDVNYRTIQRPLINLIENARLRVKPHILRPGTWKNLVAHLDGKKGFYHIVHFDVHGVLASYEELKTGKEVGSLLLHGRYALDDIVPYEGERSFLFFESEIKGTAVPVEALGIAGLLQTAQVPICLLNACQSAKQDTDGSQQGRADEAHTSLGYQIIRKGVQTVMAMRYSLSVTAAEVMMQRLYESLFDTPSGVAVKIDRAFADARTELFRDKERNARLGYTIKLEDWVLPIVYKNREVDFKLRPFTGAEEDEFYLQRESQFKFVEPKFGFHGRDIEILQVEKHLLRNNHLLVQGMGGSGKTTILKYLGTWWQRTGFVKEVFYFGYDVAPHNLNHILGTMAKELLNQEKLAIYYSKSLAVQKGWIIDALNTGNHLLILDNMESITGERLSIPNLLTEPQREELKQFLQGITGGSFVLYGSRGSEGWLAEGTFRQKGTDNTFTLGGFDPQTAHSFARKILEVTYGNQAGSGHPFQFKELFEDADFKRLMRLLGGYPLAMQAVLPLLKGKTAAKILDDLQAGVDLQAKDIQDKTQSILRCIEYSHSNLSPDAQKLLFLFAPFQSYIEKFSVTHYFKELQKIDTFQNYPFNKLEEIISESIQNGFMQPEYGQDGIYRLQPVFTYFLKNSLQHHDKGSFVNDVNCAFLNHYNLVSSQLDENIKSQDIHKHKKGLFFIRYEYDNIYNALIIALDKREDIGYMYSCLFNFYKFRNMYNECLQFIQSIKERIEQYPQYLLMGELNYNYFIILSSSGMIYLQLNKPKDAKKEFMDSIQLYDKSSNKKKYIGMADLYQNTGTAYQGLQQFDDAHEWYKKAQKIFEKSKNDYGIANNMQKRGLLHIDQVRHSLGLNINIDLEIYNEGINLIAKAGELYEEMGKKFDAGYCYQNLGEVCRDLHKYSESERYLKKALTIFEQFKNSEAVAKTNSNLGILKSDMEDYSEAIKCWKEALDTFISLGHYFSQAMIYENLGFASFKLKQYPEAKDYYHKAWDIYREHDDIGAMNHLKENLKSLAEEIDDNVILNEFI
ncbi:tetratricopeptide repeat protein [Mariniphaga sp.]|uniref:tetratricopeptide repeat protein n=1 Tax=Mariniphaga sp. TaxID=1954475 RepID=UPI0035675FD3